MELWRWSKSRLFTQGIQNKLVKAKDVTVFAEEWNSGKARGRFTAIAVLASENHPIEERVQFELK